jgi:hypothetical protein
MSFISGELRNRLMDMAVFGFTAAELDGLYPLRPAVDTRVTVTYPGNDWHDPQVINGTVVAHHHDAIDIRDDDGIIFTHFDGEADRGIILEIL